MKKTWYCSVCGGKFTDNDMVSDGIAPMCPECGNLMPTKIGVKSKW